MIDKKYGEVLDVNFLGLLKWGIPEKVWKPLIYSKRDDLGMGFLVKAFTHYPPSA